MQGKEVKGRVLVIADGATSKLATHLGYCTEPPKGVCSRAYVEGGTHQTKFDGVPLCKLTFTYVLGEASGAVEGTGSWHAVLLRTSPVVLSCIHLLPLINLDVV